jgi:hypothetical protein
MKPSNGVFIMASSTDMGHLFYLFFYLLGQEKTRIRKYLSNSAVRVTL